jgi:hypothetical protein
MVFIFVSPYCTFSPKIAVKCAEDVQKGWRDMDDRIGLILNVVSRKSHAKQNKPLGGGSRNQK